MNKFNNKSRVVKKNPTELHSKAGKPHREGSKWFQCLYGRTKELLIVTYGNTYHLHNQTQRPIKGIKKANGIKQALNKQEWKRELLVMTSTDSISHISVM